IPDTSWAENAAIPNNGGIYNSKGYLIIEPPTPSKPERNDPMNPIANMTKIKLKDNISISFLLSTLVTENAHYRACRNCRCNPLTYLSNCTAIRSDFHIYSLFLTWSQSPHINLSYVLIC